MTGEIKISQLAAITELTIDDMIVINDGDADTRKISFGNFETAVNINNSTTQISTSEPGLRPNRTELRDGDRWFNPNTQEEFIYYNEGWVLSSNPSVLDTRGLILVNSASIKSRSASYTEGTQFDIELNPEDFKTQEDANLFFLESILDLDGRIEVTAPNDGKLTIQDARSRVMGTFTANQSNDSFITIPNPNYDNVVDTPTIGNGRLTIRDADFRILTEFTANQERNVNLSLPRGFSGDYNDLTNQPLIGDGILIITNSDGSIAGSFRANEDEDVVVSLPEPFSGDYNELSNLPTNLSQFNNDVGYITEVNSLSDIGDVFVDGATSNQVLTWNGLQWIAKTFTGGEGGGGIGGDYSALSVSTAPPQDGGSLTFNNGTGVFTFRPADLDYNLLSNKPDDLGTPGDGEINVDAGPGLIAYGINGKANQSRNTTRSLMVNTGEGLEIDEEGKLAIDPNYISNNGGGGGSGDGGFTGNYDDLYNKPTIGDGSLRINDSNATLIVEFTANQTGDTTINLPEGFSGDYNDLENKPDIPDQTSDLVNDSGFITINDLPPAFSGDYEDLTNKPDLSLKADLVNGKVPTSQIPDIALSNFRGIINSEAEMTNLSESLVGDWCYRQDVTTSYMLSAQPPSVASNWLQIDPTGAVISVNGQSGVVVLGPDDVGAATEAQGEKADSAVQPEDLEDVATSGDYNDLINAPAAPNDGKLIINNSTGDPIAEFTANQAGNTTLNLPSGFSGDYNDLSNRPTIPTVNDGKLTIQNSDGNTIGEFTANQNTDVIVKLSGGGGGGGDGGFSGDYNELYNKPTIGDGKLTINDSEGEVVAVFSANQQGDTILDLPEGFSGDYIDLINKPDIPDQTSDLVNDSGFITINDLPDGFSGDYEDLTNKPDLSLKADLVNGKVPSSQLPEIALSNFRGIVANESEMTDLSESLVGDWCYRSDVSTAYILSALPASVADNWKEIETVGGVISVNGQSGVVVLGPDDIGAATDAQGEKADSAVQPEDLEDVATSGDYNDLINTPAAPNDGKLIVNNSNGDQIAEFTANQANNTTLNLPEGFSGDYDDLTDKPEIPTVNDGALIIKYADGTTAGEFTANQSSNTTINLAPGGGEVTVSDKAPDSDSDGLPLRSGDLWWNTRDGRLYVYYTDFNSSQWVDASPVVVPEVFSGDYDELTNKPDLSLKADLIDGKVPTSQIPDIALSNFRGTVSDEVEMQGLTESLVGDWCYREDAASAYMLKATPPYISSNWIPIDPIGSGVISVNGQSGTVTLGPADVGAATEAQGDIAETAVQPDELSTVAFSGDYGDLLNTPGNFVQELKSELLTAVNNSTDYDSLKAALITVLS